MHPNSQQQPASLLQQRCLFLNNLIIFTWTSKNSKNPPNWSHLNSLPQWFSEQEEKWHQHHQPPVDNCFWSCVVQCVLSLGKLTNIQGRLGSAGHQGFAPSSDLACNSDSTWTSWVFKLFSVYVPQENRFHTKELDILAKVKRKQWDWTHPDSTDHKHDK